MVMALVVFGPRRLPQIGRQIGKLMYEFRKASNDFKFQMEEELRDSEEADRRKKEEERQRQLPPPPPSRRLFRPIRPCPPKRALPVNALESAHDPGDAERTLRSTRLKSSSPATDRLPSNQPPYRTNQLRASRLPPRREYRSGEQAFPVEPSIDEPVSRNIRQPRGGERKEFIRSLTRWIPPPNAAQTTPTAEALNQHG